MNIICPDVPPKNKDYPLNIGFYETDTMEDFSTTLLGDDVLPRSYCLKWLMLDWDPFFTQL